MKEIPLTKGYVAMVDDEDFEHLSQWRWIVQRTPKKNATLLYALRTTPEGKVYMHRELTNCPDGLFVDHINRNGLDNRKANLRTCTPSQNLANREMRRNASYTTPFQGVLHLDPVKFPGNRKRFKAYTSFRGKMIYIGTYETAEEAARERDRAMLHYFGEFAMLNFPERLGEYRADPYVPRPVRQYKPRTPKSA